MTTSTVTLGIVALGLLIWAWRRRDGSLRRGLSLAWKTTRRSLLLLVAAFVVVGYVDVIVPRGWVESWIGPGSGLRGLLLAEVIGMLLPGGPYAVFPLIAGLYSVGAGVGPAVTLITSWATQALVSVTFELPFMGWRFTLVRWGIGLLFPLLAGGLVTLLF